jgi:beta-galactosidase
MNKMQLVLSADAHELKEEETYDTASVTIRAVDQNMNLLNYCNEPLRIVTEGPIKLIGPELISLKGGCAGVYVKTDKQSGKAVLRVIGKDVTAEKEFSVS